MFVNLVNDKRRENVELTRRGKRFGDLDRCSAWHTSTLRRAHSTKEWTNTREA